MKKIGLALFLSAGCAATGHSAVIVDRIVDPAAVVSGGCSHCGSGGLDGAYQGFSHFTLGANATLTGLDWEIDDTTAYGIDTVRVSLWNSDRSILLFSHDYAPADITTSPLGPMFNGNTVVLESASLPAFAIGPGSYQLGILGFGASTHQYLWLAGPAGADTWIGGGGDENPINGSFAIRLSGRTAAVPEPASWALMVGGFGALGYTLRRRGRSTLMGS